MPLEISSAKDEEKEVKSQEKCTPRVQAVIFMNLFCLCQVTYSSLAKYSTNSGVNAMDLCLVRTMINFTIAGITVRICKKHVINDV